MPLMDQSIEYLLPFLPFLSGLLAGGLFVWAFSRMKLKQVIDRACGEIELAKSTAELKLAAGDERIQALMESLHHADSELSRIRDELRSESEKRAAAEEKTNRIEELVSTRERLEKHVMVLREENTELKARLSETETRMVEERKAARERLVLLEDAKNRLSDAFKALSAEALKSNNRSFLDLAAATLEKFQEGARVDLETRQKAIGELVMPIRDSLERVDQKIGEIEKARASAFAGITEQMRSISQTQGLLHRETSQLVQALKTPSVRGRWGEIQLRRVVEIAGMVEYCDFVQQESVGSEQGSLRPDMVIRLPNERVVVVDSKAPLQAYLEALESTDEVSRISRLKDHARHIRTHLSQLSNKSYWDQFPTAPEFAVLFLPGETFFGAALEQDPSLIEFGVERGVILATPTTLIALLRAVAHGWRQEKITENALAVSELGRTLYERVRSLTTHFVDMKKGLDRAVEAFNKAVGSYEGRVLVAARRFRELGVLKGSEIERIEPVERVVRNVRDGDAPDAGDEQLRYAKPWEE